MGPVQGIFLVTEYRSLRRRSTKFRAASIVAPYFPGWRGQCLAIPGTVIWGLWLSHPFAMRLRMDGAPRVLQLLSFRHGERLALGGVVAVPLWNLHNIFAGFRNHGLTSQAGFQLLVGRHVHPVD